MKDMERALDRLPRASSLDDPEKEIIVVGYPKSGNTWVSRLLGSAIRCPVIGFKTALPLATEGLKRKSKYIVRQLHLKPKYHCNGERFLESAHHACINKWKGEKVVFVVRDPRDVVVSVKHYWNIPTIKETILAMQFATKPLLNMPYIKFMESWSTVNIPNYRIHYEQLSQTGQFALSDLIDRMGIPNISWVTIEDAVKEQEFERKKFKITHDGKERPYGNTIQAKNLRKGIVGDWKNHFTREDAELCWTAFGSVMRGFLYEKTDDWIKELG